MLETQQPIHRSQDGRKTPAESGGNVQRRRNFDLELAFTNTYRQYQKAHIAIREAMCLRVLFPALLEPIRPGDLFAGRIAYRDVGFGLDHASGGPGYYGCADNLRQSLANAEVDDLTHKRIEAMANFWQREATIEGKVTTALSPEIQMATNNGIAAMEGRLSGASLNFARLIAVGLPGLRAEVEQSQVCALQENGDLHLHAALLMVLDLLTDVCHHYARQARDMATRTNDAAWYAELQAMASVLEHITAFRPTTFREGAQLLWLYALIAGVINYGRLDMTLGALYARDIENAALTADKAAPLLQSLLRLMGDRGVAGKGRVTVGGKGRADVAKADLLALAVLEATRKVGKAGPQITLRFHAEQNPALMQKALDALAENRSHPILYNDDVNVPAVQHAFNVTTEEAEQYLPYSNGAYTLDHTSLGSLNGSLNLLKALEVTLTNGQDLLTGVSLGLPTGNFRDFATFDEFFATYQRQIEHYIAHLAQRQALEYKIIRETASFLYLTLLYDDCLLDGKALLEGGVRYLGGVVEVSGMVNAAHSLAAIKRLVYEEHSLTAERLLEALVANFVGYETERQSLLAATCCDHEAMADAMLSALGRHVAETARRQAAQVGLDYYLIANADNTGNVRQSHTTAASADGRRMGDPFTDGRSPTVDIDRQDVTAFLDAVVKPDASANTGYIQNLKFSRQMFVEERPKLEALLHAYFAQGGAQTIISIEDEEEAFL